LKSVTITEEDQNKEEEDEEEEQEMYGKKNKKGEKTSAKDTERAQTSVSILSSLTTKKEIPLFTATRRGIEKIVELIIRLHPHAIDQRDEMNRSILDVAVMYRQEKIFDIVKGKKIPLARMRRVVDKSGNTLLHHVADMKKNSGVTKPGPALQLQEELKWFEVSPFHPFVFT
jgi:ankyrin repeat protein